MQTRRLEVWGRREITLMAAQLQADVTPGRLPRTDNNKENREEEEAAPERVPAPPLTLLPAKTATAM